MRDDFIFTSESVTAGHPDKLCDQISDAIVDNFLIQDPYSSVEAECIIASGIMFITVHYASRASLDIPAIARHIITEVGYTKDVFDSENSTIMTSFMDRTSTHYAPIDLDYLDDEGIERFTSKQQITLFGFACNQTKQLLPLPIWLAHRIADRLDDPKTIKKLPYLLPDSKTQVGIEYKNQKPDRVHSINLVASQNATSPVDIEQLREDLIAQVVKPALKGTQCKIDANSLISVNPEGLLIGGGPDMHSGLTGRKTSMDTYGGYSRQSGAALSGKDPLRIDRSGAYMARYAAKNVVAAGLAEECEVQLSYSTGSASPVSVQVRTFGTSEISHEEIADRLKNVFDFRPAAIVRNFNLHKLPAQFKDTGFYRRLAVYGQMGRDDMDLPWENTDQADKLK